jgi:virginiamycin B lyase
VTAARDGILYGIDSNGHLHWWRHLGYQNGQAQWEGPKSVGVGWERYREVDAAPNGVIYALESGGTLHWWKHLKQADGVGGVWDRIPGGLKQVSVGADGETWGVSASDEIYRYTPGNWVIMPGNLRQISVGSAQQVWGTNANNDILRWTGSTWDQVPGGLKQVSAAGDGTVWGVNHTDDVYRYDPGSNSWHVVAGKLTQIAVASAQEILGINADGQAYRWLGGEFTYSTDGLKQIAVGADASLWGLQPDGTILHWANGGWEAIDGRMRQISVGTGTDVWGVNDNDEIYRYNSGPAWEGPNVVGNGFDKYQHILVAGDSTANAIYGLRPGKDIELWRHPGSDTGAADFQSVDTFSDWTATTTDAGKLFATYTRFFGSPDGHVFAVKGESTAYDAIWGWPEPDRAQYDGFHTMYLIGSADTTGDEPEGKAHCSDVDLNDEAGGEFIYLCGEYPDWARNTPSDNRVTDLRVMWWSSNPFTIGAAMELDGKCKEVFDDDEWRGVHYKTSGLLDPVPAAPELTAGAGGSKWIYMCQRVIDTSRVGRIYLHEVKVVSDSNGERGKALLQAEGYRMIEDDSGNIADLNLGLPGAHFIYIGVK